ncbi:MAG: PBP1A family penicillin-binding protein [Azoarcus sp.]|nr:PBP1A family penicillin-binding protein [Azoarcus sp.]
MRWFFYSVTALLAVGVIGLATLVVISIIIWPKLPDLDVITDYRPRVPLRVYTADGYLIQEIGEERRTLVKIENVPDLLKKALLAAEDEKFYQHIGVDMKGLLRAARANIIYRRREGASTITMQVARNFFLSPDQSFIRKITEILLSLKIEHHLTKDQILERYINQIYLGQRAHGFEVAAQTYFGKSLSDLSLAQIAMLAGLPKAPSKMNPIVNPKRAKIRQEYVLRRMREINFIDDVAYQEAVKELIETKSGSAAKDPTVLSPVHAEYVAEMARQIAVQKFGEEATQRGYKVITNITRAEQEAAYEALRQGVMDYDRRHGYRGPEKYIKLPDDLDGEKLANVIDKELSEASADNPLLNDSGDLLLAVVTEVSPKDVTVITATSGTTIKITGSGLAFAMPMLKPNSPQSRQVRRGALVRVRHLGGDKGWELTQMPDVNAALVSIDARTGALRALVGGFDYSRSQFNNAVQARRQPGSGFKPFIYSASLEKGIAPGTLISDEPLYYPPGVTGRQAWEPHNYDSKFAGMMTVREALVRSKNIPAIKVLETITPDYAREYIANFGFDTSKYQPYLTIALGAAGEATPWEMARAYAVFANGGFLIQPYVVKEIQDATGKTVALFDAPVAGESAPLAIDPRNAWVMNSMLQDVVSRGTGSRAGRALKRKDIAGKTGTTNDYIDAWFCGYNPEIVAISWIGFPQPRNMGSGETGGTAALPIWINYMKTALSNKPEIMLPRPENIASAPVGEGDHDDYYLPPFPPPELQTPIMDDNGLLTDLEGPPANATDYTPPAPVPQPHGNDQPLHSSGGTVAPLARPEDAEMLGNQGF